jgi:type I restriction enzyme, R subunit
VLTHHTLKSRGAQPMALQPGLYEGLLPATGVGTRMVRDPGKALLSEIIEKVNDLFSGDLSGRDKLVYVNDVIKGKLLESDTLAQQAASNSKEQFANSPDLKNELLRAIMDALDAHSSMSTQALNSEAVRRGLQDILLNHTDLYESLRGRAA